MTQESLVHTAHATRPGVPRIVFGVLRIAAGLLVLAAIATQITDKVLHNDFIPTEYYSYFTIQSSHMNIVVLIVGGFYALRHQRDTELLTSVRLSIFTYAVVTGVVYNVLLRNIPDTGYIGVQWPSDVNHVIMPIFIALDWVFGPGRARLPWRRIWFALAYPLVWVAFTLVRGLATAWFPYPFMQPTGPGGWPSVIAYILGIAAFVVVVSALAIAVTRFRSKTDATGDLTVRG